MSAVEILTIVGGTIMAASRVGAAIGAGDLSMSGAVDLSVAAGFGCPGIRVRSLALSGLSLHARVDASRLFDARPVSIVQPIDLTILYRLPVPAAAPEPLAGLPRLCVGSVGLAGARLLDLNLTTTWTRIVRFDRAQFAALLFTANASEDYFVSASGSPLVRHFRAGFHPAVFLDAPTATFSPSSCTGPTGLFSLSTARDLSELVPTLIGMTTRLAATSTMTRSLSFQSSQSLESTRALARSSSSDRTRQVPGSAPVLVTIAAAASAGFQSVPIVASAIFRGPGTNYIPPSSVFTFSALLAGSRMAPSDLVLATVLCPTGHYGCNPLPPGSFPSTLKPAVTRPFSSSNNRFRLTQSIINSRIVISPRLIASSYSLHTAAVVPTLLAANGHRTTARLPFSGRFRPSHAAAEPAVSSTATINKWSHLPHTPEFGISGTLTATEPFVVSKIFLPTATYSRSPPPTPTRSMTLRTRSATLEPEIFTTQSQLGGGYIALIVIGVIIVAAAATFVVWRLIPKAQLWDEFSRNTPRYRILSIEDSRMGV
jgi:hypothetical protein